MHTKIGEIQDTRALFDEKSCFKISIFWREMQVIRALFDEKKVFLNSQFWRHHGYIYHFWEFRTFSDFRPLPLSWNTIYSHLQTFFL